MKAFGKKILQSLFLTFRAVYLGVMNVGYKAGLSSVYNIPIIINNFNRLSYPIQLIDFLGKCGFTNIIILDNNSSYPPLLQFYANSKCKVIRADQNYGHLAFWQSGLYSHYKWSYFVYTDSDVLPIAECPKDFIIYFKMILNTHYKLDKVGFGIKIDDLPKCFSLRDKVVQFEMQYWQNEVTPNLYGAPIDTTFALYKPFSKLKDKEIYTLNALRTGFPYLIRHLPWYVDSEHLSDEEMYYLKTSNKSSSIGQQLKGKERVY